MKEKLKKIRKSRIFTLFEILIFIALCMGVGAFIAFAQHETDPTEEAVVYFRAFVQGDYDKMYDCLYIENGSYVNKDMYKKQMQKLRESMTIDTYDIGEAEKKDGKKQITIHCTDSQTNESQDFVIKFTSKRTGFQISPDYYVNIDDMMVDNFTVVMKQKNALELNGEEITDDMAEISTDENGNQVYAIKSILLGKYKVSATNEYYAAVSNVKIKKADTKVDLTKNSYIANDKYEELIQKSGEKVIKQFYKAVRKRNPSEKKLLACFDNNSKLIEKVKTAVSESQDIVYWPDTRNIDNYEVKEFQMSKLKNSEISYNAEKKSYEITYSYSYKYVSSTDTALYTSYVYRISGKCKSTMKLTYKLKKDKIVLTNIKITNNNKKNGE